MDCESKTPGSVVSIMKQRSRLRFEGLVYGAFIMASIKAVYDVLARNAEWLAPYFMTLCGVAIFILLVFGNTIPRKANTEESAPSRFKRYALKLVLGFTVGHSIAMDDLTLNLEALVLLALIMVLIIGVIGIVYDYFFARRQVCADTV